jgi:AcrR family transcriptional regulator
LRDIAADADVNLGLLHRHFGSKDDLIREAFAAAAQSGLETIGPAETFDDAIDRLITVFRTSDATYPRMLAWMLLSGLAPRALQDDFPTLQRLVELGGPERRHELVLILVAMYGWQVFSDQVLVALGYDAADKPAVLADLAQSLRDVVNRL